MSRDSKARKAAARRTALEIRRVRRGGKVDLTLPNLQARTQPSLDNAQRTVAVAASSAVETHGARKKDSRYDRSGKRRAAIHHDNW